MTKTIKRVEQFGEPWSSNHGTLYNQAIEFTDGYQAIARSKSQQAPYKEGDVMIVEETGKATKKGTPYIRVKKPEGQQSSTGGQSGANKGHSAPAIKSINDAIGFVNEKYKRVLFAYSALSDQDLSPKEEQHLKMQVALSSAYPLELAGFDPDQKPSPSQTRTDGFGTQNDDEDDLPF